MERRRLDESRASGRSSSLLRPRERRCRMRANGVAIAFNAGNDPVAVQWPEPRDGFAWRLLHRHGAADRDCPTTSTSGAVDATTLAAALARRRQRRSRNASPGAEALGVAPRGPRRARRGGRHRPGLVGCRRRAAHRRRRHEARVARRDGHCRVDSTADARAHLAADRRDTDRARRAAPSAATPRRRCEPSRRAMLPAARASRRRRGASASRRISTRCGATATRASAISRRSPRSRAATARAGGSIVGINPLHALFPADRERASPYHPSDRRFLDPIYIDVERVPDLAASDEARALLAQGGAHASRRSPRAPTSTTAPSGQLKERLLRACFAAFDQRAVGRSAARPNSSASSPPAASRCGGSRCSRRSPRSIRACRGRHGRTRCASPTRRATRDFARAARAPRSASRCTCNGSRTASSTPRRSDARASGLAFGFFRDLAVGAAPDGAEVWANPSRASRAAWRSARRPTRSPRAARTGTCRRRIPHALRASRRRRVPRTARRQHAPRGRAADRSRHGARRGCSGFRTAPRAADGAYVRYPLEMLLARARRRRAFARAASSSARTWARCRKACASASPRPTCCRIACCGSSAKGSRFVAPARYPAKAAAACRRTTCRRSPAGGTAPTSTRKRRSASSMRGRRAAAKNERAEEKRALCDAIAAAGMSPTAQRYRPRLRTTARSRRPFTGSRARRLRRCVLLQADDLAGETERAQPARHRPGAPQLAPEGARRSRRAVADAHRCACDCRPRRARGTCRAHLRRKSIGTRVGRRRPGPVTSDGLDLRLAFAGDSATATASSTLSTQTILSLSRASAGMSSRSRLVARREHDRA